ncbi:hypothetical protein [Acetobacter conturbans]|uniref:Uncharacterized protein n=1 Tax=Acetobacter conturbans TaxID=1737472 RepID=A0ABX0K2D4_9PROT|nr:hypothetical protein [Acetobacter conturbans]NHN89849.1 hypothetical protein [Acetobacter conturbans]
MSDRNEQATDFEPTKSAIEARIERALVELRQALHEIGTLNHDGKAVVANMNAVMNTMDLLNDLQRRMKWMRKALTDDF